MCGTTGGAFAEVAQDRLQQPTDILNGGVQQPSVQPL
jgi:hypothetical protein